jgi:hypothetical protein
MKTLSSALRDGDHIEYIVRETGVNQDGKTPGITMRKFQSRLEFSDPHFCSYCLSRRTEQSRTAILGRMP